jgi:hypothetical protein
VDSEVTDMRSIVGSIAIVVAMAVTGCGDDGGGSGADGGNPPDQCDSVAGTWGVTGTCGADICDITQNGCSMALDCSGGVSSFAGSVDGNQVMFTGQTAGGVDGTCDGTITGNTMSVVCVTELGTCTFDAIRQ